LFRYHAITIDAAGFIAAIFAFHCLHYAMPLILAALLPCRFRRHERHAGYATRHATPCRDAAPPTPMPLSHADTRFHISSFSAIDITPLMLTPYADYYFATLPPLFSRH
jgi:hypothetical protein